MCEVIAKRTTHSVVNVQCNIHLEITLRERAEEPAFVQQIKTGGAKNKFYFTPMGVSDDNNFCYFNSQTVTYVHISGDSSETSTQSKFA